MVVSSIGNGGALAAMAVLLVAMAGGTYFRGCIPQGRVKVEPAVSIAVAKVAAYGASRPVAERPNQGPLTEPAADARPQGWGLLFLPHIGHSQRADPAIRSKESGHSAIGRWPAHSMTSSARSATLAGT